jgi:hypothetical protein
MKTWHGRMTDVDEHRGLVALARKFALAGAHDDALELFRSEPEVWSFASLAWAADLVAAEGDIVLLSRMARLTVLSAGRLAQLLIDRHGVDHARDSLRELLADADSGDYRSLRAPHWRLPLAAGLGRAGRPAEGRTLIQEVMAGAKDRERELALEVLIALYVGNGDLDGLQELHRGGVEAATNQFFTMLADRGEWTGLLAYARRGSHTANNAVWALWGSGAREQLEVLAAEGNHYAQYYLARLLADRDDDEGLWRQMRAGNETAERAVVDRLRRAGDTGALEGLSGEGSVPANEELVDILIRRGDIDGLRRVARPGDVHAARGLARLLMDDGDYEQACVLLEPFYGQAGGPRSPERAWELLVATSSADHREPGATATPEWVQWVAVAIGSGVLGNAAYQALIESATRTWKRLRAEPRSRAVEPAPVPAVPAAPEHRSEREAFLLACIAVHDRCKEIDAEVPDFARIGYDAMNTGDGRWVFTLREEGGRKFTVRIPPPRATSGDIVVAMYVTR